MRQFYEEWLPFLEDGSGIFKTGSLSNSIGSSAISQLENHLNSIGSLSISQLENHLNSIGSLSISQLEASFTNVCFTAHCEIIMKEKKFEAMGVATLLQVINYLNNLLIYFLMKKHLKN